MKHTEKSHVDYNNLTSSLEKMKQIANDINQAIRQVLVATIYSMLYICVYGVCMRVYRCVVVVSHVWCGVCSDDDCDSG